MNAFFAQIILAIVQGLAEWFPISSSSHLVLVSKLLEYNNTLEFDIALHFGTLMAVFAYFSRDIIEILRDVLRLRFNTENGRLGLFLIAASVPAVLLGFLLRNAAEQSVGDLRLMSLGLGVTGIFLLISSLGYKFSNKGKFGYKAVFIIGIAQAFSIFRGISRTGSTVGSGLLLGLNEKTAVKFSFLLSMPIVFGASVLSLGSSPIPKSYFLATLVSFAVGLCMIHLSYKYVLRNRKNLRWFGIYLLALAFGVGLWMFLS